MKNQHVKIWSLLSFMLILLSCSKNNERQSRTVKLSDFEEIEVNNSFDIYLVEDSCFSIEIIAHEDIIDNISSSITDNTLELSNSSSLSWLSPKDNKVDLYIHSKPLKKVYLNETCHLQTLSPITSHSFGLIMRSKTNQATLTLDCNNFYYWNDFPCGGKLTLNGKTESLKLWNFAILSVDAKYLIAKTAIVENNSQGDCIVNVSEKLNYSITNKGNINLYGSPTEIIDGVLSSSGQLIKKGDL